MNFIFNFWFHAMLPHLWQASLFGLAIALFIVSLPLAPARLRYFAGWLALCRFILPANLLAPLVGILPQISHGSSWMPAGFRDFWLPAFIVFGDGSARHPAAATVTSFSTPTTLCGIWVGGTVLLLVAGLLRLMRGLREVSRQAVPFSSGDQLRLEALASRMGLHSGSVTGYYVPPGGWLGVVGLFRSRIIVPEGLFPALDDKEAESVLLHELVHVKRHDNLLRIFQAGVVAVFWFHPLVWWLDRRLRWESERACDEQVLRLTGENQAYASGLFKAMRYALGLDLPGVSGMSRMRLKSRIQAVLNHQNRKDSPVKLAITTSALIGLFGLTTLFAAAPVPGPAEGTAAATPSKTAEQSVDQSKAAPDLGATTPSPAGKVWNITELDQIPIVRLQTQSVFSSELKKAGMKAEVIVSWVLDLDGNVGEVKVYSSTDHRFDQASMDAVRQWKFRPGMKDGHPVKVAMTCPIVFTFTP